MVVVTANTSTWVTLPCDKRDLNQQPCEDEVDQIKGLASDNPCSCTESSNTKRMARLLIER